MRLKTLDLFIKSSLINSYHYPMKFSAYFTFGARIYVQRKDCNLKNVFCFQVDNIKCLKHFELPIKTRRNFDCCDGYFLVIKKKTHFMTIALGSTQNRLDKQNKLKA